MPCSQFNKVEVGAWAVGDLQQPWFYLTRNPLLFFPPNPYFCTMKIANPLYDHAFKYLMSNDRLAKKVLSVILEKEVLELELQPQEVVIEDELRRFTLYRLDFKATIRDENGRREKVLIELQKSKLPTNVLRFRNYLGLAYMQKNAALPGKNTERDVLPIISIYILGYNVQDIPVMAVRVNHKITDLSRQAELDIRSDFIDLLNHTSYVLQVRRLPPERQSRIERFMTLFNQAWVKEKGYILDLEDVPQEFKDIAEYLQKPLLENDIQEKLRAEEEVQLMFAEQEAKTEELQTLATEALAQKEEERKQKEEALTQKEKALRKAHETTLKMARLLLQSGISPEDVARETGLSADELSTLT